MPSRSRSRRRSLPIRSCACPSGSAGRRGGGRSRARSARYARDTQASQMTVVLLSLASAALFGAMTVAVRLGLRELTDAGGAALATIIPALVVALIAAAFRHDIHHAWPFLLAGLLAPGGSQLLFTLAVREIGASRTSVAVGAAPLVAVAIALIFLDEPLHAPLILGALAIVTGGILLAAERDRPGHLRARGL